MKASLLLLVILISVSKSQAQSLSSIGDFLTGKDSAPIAGACSEQKLDPSVADLSVPVLSAQADQLKYNKKYCLAAAYYLKIMTNTLDANERTKAWVNRIESYFYQYDYEAFLDESFAFLKERGTTAAMERVHYLMLKAVSENVVANPGLDSPWVQLALGVSADQFNADSPKNYLKYRSFLDKYPNSQYTAEVAGWLAGTRKMFDRAYLKEARMMVMRREFAPAILRYQFLLNQGTDFEDLNVSMYELINLLADFSYSVSDPYKVSNQNLAHWMTTTIDQVTPAMRSQIAQQLLTQASAVLQMMKQTFPNDQWTQKASSDFADLK